MWTCLPREYRHSFSVMVSPMPLQSLTNAMYPYRAENVPRPVADGRLGAAPDLPVAGRDSTVDVYS